MGFFRGGRDGALALPLGTGTERARKKLAHPEAPGFPGVLETFEEGGGRQFRVHSGLAPARLSLHAECMRIEHDDSGDAVEISYEDIRSWRTAGDEVTLELAEEQKAMHARSLPRGATKIEQTFSLLVPAGYFHWNMGSYDFDCPKRSIQKE